MLLFNEMNLNSRPQHSYFQTNKNEVRGPGDMAGYLRALASLAKSLVQLPAYTRPFKITYNFCAGGSSAPCWPL